jgi:radical SAM superfamily enzyme YgiQ (UPF0313 family)
MTTKQEQKSDKLLLVLPMREKKNTFWVMPPVGLGYLATAARAAGYQAAILDCVKDHITPEGFIPAVRAHAPRFVGIQAFSHEIGMVAALFRRIKQFDSRIVTVLGGPHASCVPREILGAVPCVDFVFQGEGEAGLPMLLDRQSGRTETPLSSIPGLCWREGGEIRLNPLSLEDDLDRFGFPSWDLISPMRYPLAPEVIYFKNEPIAPISVTRGCPHHCTFCAVANINGRKVRMRSIPHVLDEISLLYHEHGAREIHILDDNFTFDPAYVRAFCEGLEKRRLRVSWTCPNGIRLNNLTLDTLRAMHRAGCYILMVGIESGSPRILKQIKKNLSLEMIREKVALIRQAGIEVHGFFVIGLPTETEEEIEMTRKLILELDMVGINVAAFHPFPGTEAYDALVASGELKGHADTRTGTYSHIVYSPKTIPKDRLKKIQKKLLLQFYLRPRIIGKNLREMSSFKHVKYLARRGWSYLRN